MLRACFLEGIEYDSPEDAKKAAFYRDAVTNDLRKHEFLVRGTDKEGHALIISRSRTTKPRTDDEFILTHLLIMERALACTEYLSLGLEEKVVVIMDLEKYSSSTWPHRNVSLETSSIFQNSYPERLNTLVVLEAPLLVRATYNVIKPFLDSHTKQKFHFVAGVTQRTKVFRNMVDEDQAMPFMLPNGHLTDDVSMDKFIEDVSFHAPYDSPDRESVLVSAS